MFFFSLSLLQMKQRWDEISSEDTCSKAAAKMLPSKHTKKHKLFERLIHKYCFNTHLKACQNLVITFQQLVLTRPVWNKVIQFFFAKKLSGKDAQSTPPHSKKLHAVTHILSFQTARKMMSSRCIFAWWLSAKKTIVNY